MREGLVLEVYDRHVVVLTKGGEFLKLKKQGEVSIGDVYKELSHKKIWQYYAAAAVLVLVITSFTGYNAYAHQVVGYVDIKGAKTVRLYVNRLGKVQKIDGLTSSDKIINLPINDAIKQFDDIAKKEGIYNNETKVEIDSGKLKKSNFNPDKIKQKVYNIINMQNHNNPGKDEKKNTGNPSNKKDSGNTKKSNDNKTDKKDDSDQKNKKKDSLTTENEQSQNSKQDSKINENKDNSKKDNSITTNSGNSSFLFNNKNQKKHKK